MSWRKNREANARFEYVGRPLGELPIENWISMSQQCRCKNVGRLGDRWGGARRRGGRGARAGAGGAAAVSPGRRGDRTCRARAVSEWMHARVCRAPRAGNVRLVASRRVVNCLFVQCVWQPTVIPSFVTLYWWQKVAAEGKLKWDTVFCCEVRLFFNGKFFQRWFTDFAFEICANLPTKLYLFPNGLTFKGIT